MPVMGPSDRQDDADKAFDEIAILLKDKYGVADIRKKEDFGVCQEKFNRSVEKLRKHLRKVFMYDSFNSF